MISIELNSIIKEKFAKTLMILQLVVRLQRRESSRQKEDNAVLKDALTSNMIVRRGLCYAWNK